MKREFNAGKVVKIIILAAAGISAVSLVIMSLWNGVLIKVVSVNSVNFWQALGIFILCKILFGFGGGRGHGGNPWVMRQAMKRKMRDMNEEERAKFKEEMFRRMDFWYNRDNFCRSPFGSSQKKWETDNNKQSDASN